MFRHTLLVASSRCGSPRRLTFEDGTDKLSRNVGNYRSLVHNIPEERRSQQLTNFTLYISAQPDVMFEKRHFEIENMILNILHQRSLLYLNPVILYARVSAGLKSFHREPLFNCFFFNAG